MPGDVATASPGTLTILYRSLPAIDSLAAGDLVQSGKDNEALGSAGRSVMKSWQIGVLVGIFVTILASVVDAQPQTIGERLAISGAALVQAFDSDGDGMLSAAEIDAARAARQGDAARIRGGERMHRGEFAAGAARTGLMREMFLRGFAMARGFVAGRAFTPSWRGRWMPPSSFWHGGGPWASRPEGRVGRPWPRDSAAAGDSATPAAEAATPGAEFMMRRFDTDEDGVLLPSEVSPRMWQWLEGADADGDGRISADELKAAAQTQRSRWRGREPQSPAEPPQPPAPPDRR